MENIERLELSGELSLEQADALELHYEIIAKGNLAASAMVDFCKSLKKMRDERKYLLLGHDSFEEYVEQEVGLKQRQAYSYIQAFESLGESFLQSNAKLGISKLSMLAALPWHERDDVLENNDIGEMSTRELKETIDKLHDTQEQLSLITEERDKLAEESREYDELSETIKRLREAKEQPSATIMREPTEAEIKQYADAAVKKGMEKERARLEKEKQKAVDKATADAKKAAEEAVAKRYKAEMEKAAEREGELTARLERAEKDSKLAMSPGVYKFSCYFDSVQSGINAMYKIIASADAATGEKLKSAMQQLGQALLRAEAANG